MKKCGIHEMEKIKSGKKQGRKEHIKVKKRKCQR